MTRKLFASIAVGLVLLPCSAGAQLPGEAQGRLPELGRSLAGAEDSTAILVNPANLAFIPNGELRYTGTFLRDSNTSGHAGHALSLALPLGRSISTGLRLDFVNPPSGSVPRAGLNDPSYRWWTWALGFRLTDSVSLGGSVQGATGEGAFGNNLLSLSFASSFRPWDFLGASVVFQDIGDPSNRYGTKEFSLTAAVAIRPLGTRALELGLESKSIGENGEWVPRATLAVDVPSVGRVRGEFQMADSIEGDSVWSASLGLAFNLQATHTAAEIYAAGLTGSAHNSEVGADWQLSAAVRGFSGGAGLRLGRYAVRMRLEKTPSIRGHVAWLRHLWTLAEDEQLDAVLLELRGSPGASFAHIQELRDAVQLLRDKGKRVFCHLHGGNAASLYLCAAANAVAIQPAATIEFSGLSNQYLYFGRLLEKLGIRAEVVSVGEHKSAPEGYTRSEPSDVAHADKQDLLEQRDAQLMEGLGKGLGWSAERTREVLEKGPYVAERARAIGLVDQVLFDDEIPAAVSEWVGDEVRLRDARLRRRVPERFGAQPSIALIYVEGEMVDGRSDTTPLTGSRSAGSYTIAAALRSARLNPRVKAVVLRVETPGGSALAADVIWREVELTAKAKPVVVSMGGYAASGGYYISAAGTFVFANPLTVTGSIGVFMLKPDASELLERVGVDVSVYQSNPSADANAPYRGFSEAERVSTQAHLQRIYERFVERVASGRKMKPDAVDAVARGRVWTGQQAQDRGLVDELGGLRQALAHARELAGLSSRARIVELPVPSESLVSRALGIPGISGLVGLARPGNERASIVRALAAVPQLSGWVQAAEPYLVHGSRVPMLRLEYSVVSP